LSPLTATVARCFFAAWIVLIIGGFVVFTIRRDAAFKRTWYPRYVMLVGVLFVVFATTIMVLGSRSFEALGGVVILVPMAALLTYLNIRFTVFCDHCGATVRGANRSAAPRTCPGCGAALSSRAKGDRRR
jgi:drug/metabolite transporter superfamily protein YnfA